MRIYLSKSSSADSPWICSSLSRCTTHTPSLLDSISLWLLTKPADFYARRYRSNEFSEISNPFKLDLASHGGEQSAAAFSQSMHLSCFPCSLGSASISMSFRLSTRNETELPSLRCRWPGAMVSWCSTWLIFSQFRTYLPIGNLL